MWASVLTAVAGLVTWLTSYFSAEARLARAQIATAVATTQVTDEASRLTDKYTQIDMAPPRPPADLLQRLRRP